MNFTFNNHLSYSIGDRLFGDRETSMEKFYVRLGKVDQNIYNKSSYREELRRTASLVYEDLGKDLVVLLSGGTDSEIVVRNFVEIGVKPKCISVKFVDDFNNDDISEATAIAEELGLQHYIVDFDIKEFYMSGEAEEFGNRISCTQLAYLMSYYNILKIGAPAVMGGEVFLTRNVGLNGSYWSYTFRENEDASAMRFSLKYNIPLVNEWFSYTPELLLYYLETPEIRSLVTEKYNYKLSSVSSKNKILNNLYPGLRKKTKTHGFENLRGFNHEVYRKLSSMQIKRLENSLDGIPLNNAISMLKGL